MTKVKDEEGGKKRKKVGGEGDIYTCRKARKARSDLSDLSDPSDLERQLRALPRQPSPSASCMPDGQGLKIHEWSHGPTGSTATR